nr:MAG TPA: hypothetical protein [Caudoviricetes sp.]
MNITINKQKKVNSIASFLYTNSEIGGKKKLLKITSYSTLL